MPVDAKNASTAIQRIGVSALAALILTLLVIVAVMGFFGFIFWGDASDKNWHTIMVRGWATRAISIPSLVLRAAVDIQAGIVAAMLAALALESGSVLLRDAARVSTARVTKTRPRSLLLPLIVGSRWNSKYLRDALTIAAVAILTTTTLVMQFSSTILLSDLRLGILPGIFVFAALPFILIVTGTPEISPIALDFSYYINGNHTTSPDGWTSYRQQGYKTNLLSRLPTVSNSCARTLDSSLC